MLAKPHDWDTAQMPVNVMDPHYRSFTKEVIPVCLKKNVGVIGMKGLGGGHPKGRFLTEVGITSDECYRFCLSQPVTAQVMGITSMEQLKQDVALARSFKPLSPAGDEFVDVACEGCRREMAVTSCSSRQRHSTARTIGSSTDSR